MPRIMAIDYGSKRVGIAVTDPSQLIATGLTTVDTKDILSFLKTYCAKEVVDCFVVGEPKRLNNTATDATPFVNAFVKLLKQHFPLIRIERIDERFTSKIAFQTMIDSGITKNDRRNKALIDEISATLILQSYLEKKQWENHS